MGPWPQWATTPPKIKSAIERTPTVGWLAVRSGYRPIKVAFLDQVTYLFQRKQPMLHQTLKFSHKLVDLLCPNPYPEDSQMS
jgi:hypothetical protein